MAAKRHASSWVERPGCFVTAEGNVRPAAGGAGAEVRGVPRLQFVGRGEPQLPACLNGSDCIEPLVSYSSIFDGEVGMGSQAGNISPLSTAPSSLRSYATNVCTCANSYLISYCCIDTYTPGKLF